MLEKVAEREALVAFERLVKAMDAVGPASVRMCFGYVVKIFYYDIGETTSACSPCTRVAPKGEVLGAWSDHLLPYVLRKRYCSNLRFAFFSLLLTNDIREHHLYPVIGAEEFTVSENLCKTIGIVGPFGPI